MLPAKELQIITGVPSAAANTLVLSAVSATKAVTPGVYMISSDIDCNWADDVVAVTTDIPLGAGNGLSQVVALSSGNIAAIAAAAGTLQLNRLGDIS